MVTRRGSSGSWPKSMRRRLSPDVDRAELSYREALAFAAALGMAHSSPTATSVSASSTGAQATVSRPETISRSRRECTGRSG
jgi:hypothetical protein